MQSKEFDKMLDGQMSKLFDLEMLNAKMFDISNISKEKLKEEIEKNEFDIPAPLKFKIDIFVEQQRQQSVSEEIIREMVKEKFNIEVFDL